MKEEKKIKKKINLLVAGISFLVKKKKCWFFPYCLFLIVNIIPYFNLSYFFTLFSFPKLVTTKFKTEFRCVDGLLLV